MRKKSQKIAADICPKCEGSGYVFTDTGAQPCECSRDRELEQAFRNARLPKKFLTKSLDSFTSKEQRQKDILLASKSFLQTFRGNTHDDPGKGLLLLGREGSGKTHIAIALLKEVIRKGYTGLYWNVPELFLELRRLMSGNSDVAEADLFDEARRVDLLVLDDLGAERSSEYVLDRLYVLINGRYQNDTSTIITSNCTLDELRNQIGPRIVSRICEMCVPVEFPKEDYRIKHMNETFFEKKPARKAH
jgi:DNA replication protein DnaC